MGVGGSAERSAKDPVKVRGALKAHLPRNGLHRFVGLAEKTRRLLDSEVCRILMRRQPQVTAKGPREVPCLRRRLSSSSIN